MISAKAEDAGRPLILSIFPTFAIGGAQSRFAAVANHFGAKWRHAIVAMDGVTSAAERLGADVPVIFPPVTVRRGDTIGNVRRFRAVLRAMRPDALLTHNFGSIEWAIANRPMICRHVHVEDGFGPDEQSRQIARRVWLRRVFLRGRTVVLPSRTLMGIATEQWRLRARDVRYVPNGVDLARFAQARTQALEAYAAVRGHGALVVGTVAALRKEKNLGRLVRAFAEASKGVEARLVIIGDGTERAGLERLAADLGLGDRVWFAGHIADPAALLAGLDVFALSSDTEQMPISLLEAMACGLPVVGTDVGDVAAMLDPAQRPFVVARSDAALAQGLGQLLRDAALRARLGAANRLRAEGEFGQDRMFAAWGALLNPAGEFPIACAGNPGQ